MLIEKGEFDFLAYSGQCGYFFNLQIDSLYVGTLLPRNEQSGASLLHSGCSPEMVFKYN